MDDETKDFSELNLNETNKDDLDNTIEVTDDKLLTVNEQIKEIKKEEIDNKIEELKTEQDNNRKLSKTLIILIIVLGVLLISFICYLLFFKNKPNDPSNNTSTIVRPDENQEYIILKQNQISFSCNKTSNGEKFKTLKKGLVIECDFTVNTTQNISELYFDITHSSNLKLKELKNNSDYTLVNDKDTYKLTTTTPFNNLKEKILFYFEVTNIEEKTGYAEIENIVFKDDKDNYYKMTDNIFAFPPEYNDKIYIYKQTIDNETNYIASKASLNDEEHLELIDTFKCETEECEVKNNYKNNFVIYDNNLLIYDVLLRTKQTIRIEENNFDYTKYEYEAISNKDGNLIGLLFKNNYKENYDCSIFTNRCIEKSISGYNVSYYSLNRNMFTIALDYGFTGANIYEEYDLGLMLMKDNMYGVFSYDEDNMILELSDKYNSIEYESSKGLVKLGVYDKKNKQNYYSYYNLNNNSFVIDVKGLESVNSSKKIYYIAEPNPQGKMVYMLFNSKGEALKDIKYTTLDQIELVTDNTLVIKNNEDFDIYDLDGNFIETSQYVQSGLNILKTTKNYYLALNSDNELIVTNHIGKTIGKLMPSEKLNDIYEVDTMNIVKCEEVSGILEVIITNSNIAEEEKNAYKFNIDNAGKVTMDYINYEQ